ncbi:MAG: topoisomerase IV [Ruminococcaceae bacterium]|nr:topoisomerase IV [Oscillospiraceae bacterium]
MAKKKKTPQPVTPAVVAEIRHQPITETVEKNFMPYAMSVIVARAIPSIDGFKPSHRKVLYTMYKMGLMSGPRVKSANVASQAMLLNPHGDAANYETLVRLTHANEALLHPFVDSKGTFGKHFSSDMDYSAPRYTECRLDKFCTEIFSGIDKDAVDFVENYDSTTTEPVLLPVTFPNILVSPNIGVAVGMACSICSFNLAEICDGTIQLLKNPNTDIERLLDIIRAPDFPSGGSMIYDRDKYREVFRTGHGSIRVRSRYHYDKDANCIDVLQIPYSTTIEAIIKKMVQLIKEGKLKEVVDVRDEIDISGFKLTIDLRRGTDPDKLMQKLYKMTPLEDSFECNFNVLIGGTPRVLGVRELLNEWIDFRVACVRREVRFDLNKKKDKLHLLLGLGKILLDIDKAIKIVRETAKEQEVVPNLMAGFSIDRIQAEYIAEIKLRYLNREYIINRIKEIESLQNEIADLEQLASSETRLKNKIAAQLKEIKQKYGKPRQTQIIGVEDIEVYDEDDMVDNYNVKLIFTKEGYFKKITLQSLRGNDEQKLKEGDFVLSTIDASNTDEIFVFSDKAQVYRAKVSEFDTVKASQLGDYLPAKLGFEEDERALAVLKLEKNYAESGHVLIFFANGKGVRLPISAYETKAYRRKLTGAYSDASEAVGCVFVNQAERPIYLVTSSGKAMVIDSSLVPEKATRTSQGVILMTQKNDSRVVFVSDDPARFLRGDKSYRKNKLPSAGTTLDTDDRRRLPDSIQDCLTP